MKKSIVVAGSHGKTTVTSLCAAVLEMAGFDPTVINGGVINSYKTNAKLGSGDWTVIESDESDGSFTKFFPTIGIVTNIDKEHITHYGNFENLKNSFKTFLNNIPFYGVGIVCVDDENICDVIKDVCDVKIITYSIKNNSMFKAENIRKTAKGTIFDVAINTSEKNEVLKDISIPILGDHNIKNSLSTIAAAFELGIDFDTVKSTLSSFAGVKRRFTKVGNISSIPIIDDYAHHPTEIKALLSSGKQYSNGRIVLIHQPHRFTRLNTLFDEFTKCFDMADELIIVPVYKADDVETGKIDATDLFKALKEKGKKVSFIEGVEELQTAIAEAVKTGGISKEDLIIFSGAGSISKWAYEITKNLGELI